MKFRPTHAARLLPVFLLASLAAQDDERDSMLDRLDEAITDYRATEAATKAALLAEIDTRIEALPSRSLPKDHKLALHDKLTRARDALADLGELPDCDALPELKHPIDRFERDSKRSRSELQNAFDAAEKHFASRDLEVLKEIRDRRDKLLGLEASEAAARLARYFPVGTKLDCRRTWDGGEHTVKGKVIRSEAGALVVEAGSRSKATPRIWTFGLDEQGVLQLKTQLGKDPSKGGVCTNCTGGMRFDQRGLHGDYAWDLVKPQRRRVSGEIAWTISR